MKVILLKHVPTLGLRGDVVTVADGYARNLLFPKKLAQVVTTEALEHVQQERRVVETVQKERERDVRKIATRLNGQRVQTQEKADVQGHLYGSVNAHRLTELLKSMGYEVEEKWIALAQPIKTIGEHTVEVRFPGGKKASVTIEVRAIT